MSRTLSSCDRLSIFSVRWRRLRCLSRANVRMSAAERKSLSRKRARDGTKAPGRIHGAEYETRPTPTKTGNTYQHELSPGEALSPHSKKKLQTRRSSRIAAARNRSAVAKVRAAAAQPPQQQHLIPLERKEAGWLPGEKIWIGGKVGRTGTVTETIGGRYLKIDLGGMVVLDGIMVESVDSWGDTISRPLVIDGWFDAECYLGFSVAESDGPPPLTKPLRLLAEQVLSDTTFAPSTEFTQVREMVRAGQGQVRGRVGKCYF